MNFLKINIYAISLIFAGSFSSCDNNNKSELNPNSQSIENTNLWQEASKNNFIKQNAKNEYEKYVIAKIIEINQSSKDSLEILNMIKSAYFENFKKTYAKEYKFEISKIALKSKKEIESLFGSPIKKEKVNPSNTTCPCDKWTYLGDMIEIVYIGEKADWITIYNSGTNIDIGDISTYLAVNNFDDHTYIKVKTK